MRARLAPAVATGSVKCARCGELIGPDDEWHLDHRDDGRGWLGPSHKRCNLRAGFESMAVSVANGNGHREHAYDRPLHWSQRWHDDPEVGTRVLLGGGMCEVYLGSGVWSLPVPFVRDES